MMKAGRKRKAEDNEVEEGESGNEMDTDNKEENIDNDNLEAGEVKRGITYQVRHHC